MAAIQVSTGGGTVGTYHDPDTCPICHHVVTPNVRWSTLEGKSLGKGLRVLYSCPNPECSELFIGYFVGTAGNQYDLINTRPSLPTPMHFSETIKKISATF